MDNLKMAVVGTHFDDGHVSIAWGTGRNASEVRTVPPSQRSVDLQRAILAGVVVETADAATVDPTPPPASTTVRIVGDPNDGDVPIWDSGAGHFVPGVAGASIGSNLLAAGLSFVIEG